jgi:carbohydrate-selective porin OprB
LRGIFLDNHELGLEVFYNLAATNWLSVTPDVQVIAEPTAKGAETAFLTGLRLEMRF